MNQTATEHDENIKKIRKSEEFEENRGNVKTFRDTGVADEEYVTDI